MACSDDDPVKKNPYLQTSTRAMLKEVVEVVFNNIDSNTDVTVDFGDGSTEKDPYLRLIGTDRSHEAIQGCR